MTHESSWDRRREARSGPTHALPQPKCKSKSYPSLAPSWMLRRPRPIKLPIPTQKRPWDSPCSTDVAADLECSCLLFGSSDKNSGAQARPGRRHHLIACLIDLIDCRLMRCID